MYVELDHALVPGKIEDINKDTNLTGRVKQSRRDCFDPDRYLLNKYEVKKQGIMEILATKAPEFEAVVGTKEDVVFDHDFGFFSAILACYNNHWVLKTSPDDWWNVIVRNVALAVDDKGEKAEIREYFVAHEGKKSIDIRVGPPRSLPNVDYSWLFNQFSNGIKSNIKTPGYADLMQADFSTIGPDQIVSTQIMLMSSLQKYFDFGCHTMCGIPGVEMLGSEHDWIRLLEKTKQLRNLRNLLEPVEGVLGLEDWFQSTEDMVARLLATYRGEPDKEWWGHVLSWNVRNGSGARSWWSGWMIDFLMAGKAERPRDFQSGVVSVPVKIDDQDVSDTGRLVAGTVGFTLEEGRQGRQVVQARQGWVSPVPVPLYFWPQGQKYKFRQVLKISSPYPCPGPWSCTCPCPWPCT